MVIWLAVFVVFLMMFRTILLPFIAGMALAYFLDPVADKIMVSTALVLIVEHYNTVIVTIPALTMIGREILISALREWMAELGKRSSVAVGWMGKWKTTIQMIALTGLIWEANIWMVWASYILLYVAVILTFSSMMQYLRAAWGDLTAHH